MLIRLRQEDEGKRRGNRWKIRGDIDEEDEEQRKKR